MGSAVRGFLLAMGLLLAGCSSMKWPHLPAWPWQDAKPDNAALDRLAKARAQARVLYAAEAAVGRPGTFVCRKMTTGIAESDWIRGTVIEAKEGRVKVEISDPGKFPFALGGVEIAKGALVWDEDTSWVPCLK